MKRAFSTKLRFPYTLHFGGQSMPDLVTRMERRINAPLSPWLKGALACKSFQAHSALQSLTVVAVTPEELGLTQGPGRVRFSHVLDPEVRRKKHLSLCSHDVAFALFLSLQGKFEGERLLLMSLPLHDHQQDPVLLEVGDSIPGVQAVWAKPTFPTLWYQRLLFIGN